MHLEINIIILKFLIMEKGPSDTDWLGDGIFFQFAFPPVLGFLNQIPFLY